MELSEAEVKSGVEEYLTYAMNQGKLWFARLNAGDIYIPNKDGSYRLFKGVGKGTADYLVLQDAAVQGYWCSQPKGERLLIVLATFIECKSSKGKTTKEQDEFEEMITKLNCKYIVVRNVEELIKGLE